MVREERGEQVEKSDGRYVSRGPRSLCNGENELKIESVIDLVVYYNHPKFEVASSICY